MTTSSSFRTLSISDRRFEADHLLTAVVKSEALGRRGEVTLFVPPGIEGKVDVPLAIMLHGVYSSHWAWTRKGGLHETACRLIASGHLEPMVVAMPSDGLWGDGTGYLPLVDCDVETWIMTEVPSLVAELVPEVSTRSMMFIGGLSMGGFGAIRLGVRYADRIAAISAHSTVTSLLELADFVAEPLLEVSLAPSDHDLGDVLTRAAKVPPLRFDCGRDDPLLESNRLLSLKLANNAIAHEYEEYDGGHDWAYWSQSAERSLRFFDAERRRAEGRNNSKEIKS